MKILADSGAGFLLALAIGTTVACGAAVRREEAPKGCEAYLGAITRGPTESKKIALCFTAHSFGEGAEVILDTLQRHGGKASFFLTGEFLSRTNFAPIIMRMLREGHYVGPHSDGHLLYCAWGSTRETLVTREEFQADLKANLLKLKKYHAEAGLQGPAPWAPTYFLPPYEHYNREIADWTKSMGMVLVNYTPGTRSNADYTGEADHNFVSSQKIYDSILEKEAKDPNGLNGFLLLLHLGAGPGRADKFASRFPELCRFLSEKGYQFVAVPDLLAPPAVK